MLKGALHRLNLLPHLSQRLQDLKYLAVHRVLPHHFRHIPIARSPQRKQDNP